MRLIDMSRQGSVSRAKRRWSMVALAVCTFLSLAFSANAAPAAKKARGTTAPQTAKQFVDKLDGDLRRLVVRLSTADWIKNTYITGDTERNAATASQDLMEYSLKAIKDSARFQVSKLDPDTARKLYLLKVSQTLIAPSDAKKREELATIMSRLEGIYGTAKWCGRDKKGKCRDLEELTEVMRHSRSFDELLDAWTGWHSTSVEMRPMYQRLVDIANEGAREIGFADTGQLWRAGYDMSPAEFEKETDRLWEQVKPFYEQLHCYVRGKLVEKYGADKVPPEGPIPAHLLGNMWAQEWLNVYPLVEPYPGEVSLDVNQALKDQTYDATRLVKLAESFFVSLGLDPLPDTFWQRSMFLKPRDREVVCHASAWDVTYSDDLRVKMCFKINEEDLITIHHELGHDYYFHYYYKLPLLFQAGANDGFHEAIGDALTLSITPAYLKQVGLLSEAPKKDKALINVQMKNALEKVAFLPFGKLIDQWRWDVFAGKTNPGTYNAAWWALRRKYQGVNAPIARSEENFDPGAKFHVAANVPYTRYFLARILQFQFHRAMCLAAHYPGPLHECSIYGSKEAGDKLRAMLELGASKPWPEALYVLTGQREMDAKPLLAYFAPLRNWLRDQNKGRKCGW